MIDTNEKALFKIQMTKCAVPVYVDARDYRGPFFTLSGYGRTWRLRGAAQKRMDEIAKHFPELAFSVVPA